MCSLLPVQQFLCRNGGKLVENVYELAIESREARKFFYAFAKNWRKLRKREILWPSSDENCLICKRILQFYIFQTNSTLFYLSSKRFYIAVYILHRPKKFYIGQKNSTKCRIILPPGNPGSKDETRRQQTSQFVHVQNSRGSVRVGIQHKEEQRVEWLEFWSLTYSVL